MSQQALEVKSAFVSSSRKTHPSQKARTIATQRELLPAMAWSQRPATSLTHASEKGVRMRAHSLATSEKSPMARSPPAGFNIRLMRTGCNCQGHVPTLSTSCSNMVSACMAPGGIARKEEAPNCSMPRAFFAQMARMPCSTCSSVIGGRGRPFA